jgi:cell division septum initiation protein DivIVA
MGEEKWFADCFDSTLASLKNGIVRGSIEVDDLDKALEIKEAMDLSQDDLWQLLGMSSRYAMRKEMDRHYRSWTVDAEGSQRRIQMAYDRVRATYGDQPAKSTRLDDMGFVRRGDASEYAELEAKFDQAKMDIDVLHPDNQALRAALELVTSEVPQKTAKQEQRITEMRRHFELSWRSSSEASLTDRKVAEHE